jgi:hypothetical protein
MTTTHTDWHGYSAYEYEPYYAPYAYEMQEILGDVSAPPPVQYTLRVNWPVALGWGTLFIGSGAVWWFAALGVGRLTGWW